MEHPESEWKLITKEWARDRLDQENYLNNRAMCEHRIVQYCADIENKRWIQTHQGIAFDVNGKLVDGQHRLAAIALTGMSQWMLVTTGLPVEARYVIDQAKPRSVADCMRIKGKNKDKGIRQLVSIAKHIMQAPEFVRIKWSFPQMDDMYKRNLDWMKFAQNCKLFKTKIRNRGTFLALLCRASDYLPSATIDRFDHVLATGETMTQSEYMIIKLRDWTMSSGAKSWGFQSYERAYRMGQTVLHAFSTSERVEWKRTIPEEFKDLYPLSGKRTPKWKESVEKLYSGTAKSAFMTLIRQWQQSRGE
jgi:hypothetical protein